MFTCTVENSSWTLLPLLVFSNSHFPSQSLQYVSNRSHSYWNLTPFPPTHRREPNWSQSRQHRLARHVIGSNLDLGWVFLIVYINIFWSCWVGVVLVRSGSDILSHIWRLCTTRSQANPHLDMHLEKLRIEMEYSGGETADMRMVEDSIGRMCTRSEGTNKRWLASVIIFRDAPA